MAIAWLSGLGGAAAVVITSPLKSLIPLELPHFRLMEAPVAALGTPKTPVELDASFGQFYFFPANWRVFDLNFSLHLTSAFFKSDGCDSVAYLH